MHRKVRNLFMNLEKKKQITEDLHEKFLQARMVILTHYKGMNAESMTDLRRRLRQSNAEYRVVKNTLLIRAAEGTCAAPLRNAFTGPSAVLISTGDPVPPAKVIADFVKTNDKLEIRTGALQGRVLAPGDIKALANLPSREVLLGQTLSVMNAVPTSFVRLLSAVPQKFMYLLSSLRDQKQETPAPAA